MQPSERAHYQALLMQLHSHLKEQKPLKPELVQEGHDEDLAPLHTMLQSITSSRNQNQQRLFERVNAALQRLAQNPESFGLCLDCDEPIIEGRLKLMPYAELCVPCQEAVERQRAGYGRRSLTDYTE